MHTCDRQENLENSIGKELFLILQFSSSTKHTRLFRALKAREKLWQQAFTELTN